MALQYGMNITASDMRSLLEKNDKQQSGVRTWRQLFGNASLGFNAQSDALTTDYTDAIAKAYESNFRQNDAIMGAGLASGVTKEMLSASRNDLHTAYETYVRNYGSDMATAAETYGKEVGTIDAALTERATNFSKLYNSAYKYLSEELFGATQSVRGTAENGAVAKYKGEGKNAEFTGYEPVNRDYINEHGLQWIYRLDEDGNPTTELRDWDDLSHDLFNDDNTLTKRGVQFFDQMFNTPYENYMHVDGKRDIRSFDEWLSDTDAELRDWWIGQDVFNYNFAGTNRGTSQVLTGRESTDNIYGAYEYADTSGLNRSLPSTTGFDTIIGAYEEAVTEYLDVYNHYLSTPSSVTPNSPGADARTQVNTAKKAYDRAKENLSTSWLKYTEQIKTERNNTLDLLQSKVGTEMYNEFLRENGDFVDSYAALLNVDVGSPTLGDPKEIEAYGKDVVKRYRQAWAKLDEYYQELLTRIRVFIKKHGYDGKTSGF